VHCLPSKRISKRNYQRRQILLPKSDILASLGIRYEVNFLAVDFPVEFHKIYRSLLLRFLPPISSFASTMT